METGKNRGKFAAETRDNIIRFDDKFHFFSILPSTDKSEDGEKRFFAFARGQRKAWSSLET